MTVICNQAASFKNCLFKVQQDMHTQLTVIRTESKGKSASKVSNAKTMEHLTDFVFVSMGNLTSARRDSYLTHVKTGIKPDTFPALRTSPLQLATLFPDCVIKRAEDDHTARVGITLMSVQKGNLIRDLTNLHGRVLVQEVIPRKARVDCLITPPDWPRPAVL